MNEKDKEWIESVIGDTNDNTKYTIKRLKEITNNNWPDVTDSIFDPKDTCLCSASMRKQYKNKFINHYEGLNKI